MHGTINLYEGILWLTVGAGFVISLVKRDQRVAKLVAACTFVAFGSSDFVEMATGAWWRPWWLFVWKAACVIMMVGLLVAYLRRQRRARQEAKGDPPA